mmetsp:Transcript_6869/g.14998  ORF Transcript_6869/g.14998 Transcript_6869/m.14998 type:complete len:90 (-) Transcript_6869:744-1013(-)
MSIVSLLWIFCCLQSTDMYPVRFSASSVVRLNAMADLAYCIDSVVLENNYKNVTYTHVCIYYFLHSYRPKMSPPSRTTFTSVAKLSSNS